MPQTFWNRLWSVNSVTFSAQKKKELKEFVKCLPPLHSSHPSLCRIIYGLYSSHSYIFAHFERIKIVPFFPFPYNPSALGYFSLNCYKSSYFFHWFFVAIHYTYKKKIKKSKKNLLKAHVWIFLQVFSLLCTLFFGYMFSIFIISSDESFLLKSQR